MSLKNQKTKCTGMEWDTFLSLTDKLKKEQDYRNLLLITLGCYFGLRASDLLQLRFEQLLNREYFDMVEKKTKKLRRITINLSVKDLLQFLIRNEKINSTGFIFINKSGVPLSIQFINRELHKIFKKHKISVENPSSHTLRKTFGKAVWTNNNCSDKGLILLSEVFGHSSQSITRRYIGINDQVIHDLYLSL